MTTSVVLEDTGFGVRAAVLDDERRLIEVRDADRDDPRATDALFAARVATVDPKLNAAFVDCGLPRPALLVAKDARAVAGGGERRPIRELVREGQRLIVQGLREPVDDKGARVTSDVRLFGYALVHSPFGSTADPTRGHGRRRDDELRARGLALFPEGRFALRRHAAGLPDEALRQEADRLAARWRGIETAARTAKVGRLAEPEATLERVLRGLIDLEPASVAVADQALALELERLLAAAPTLPPLRVARLDPDEPAFAQTGVDEALELVLGAEVPLRRGGRLLVEPTAACVAIDVDGGGRAALDVDLEAAAEIARQVRLRNLGGTIVVDFVDLPTRPERQRLDEALKKAFRGDPAPVEVHAMSSLGVVQISRARRGEPLASLFVTSCACCAGIGRQPSARAGAEGLLAALRRERRPVARVRVAPGLRDFLRAGPGAGAWRRAAERLGQEPALAADPALAPAGFAVEGG